MYQFHNFCGYIFFVLQLGSGFRGRQLKNSFRVYFVFEFQKNAFLLTFIKKKTFFNFPHCGNGGFHFVYILAAGSGRAGCFVDEFCGKIFHGYNGV